MNSPHQMEPFEEEKKMNRFGGLNRLQQYFLPLHRNPTTSISLLSQVRD